MADSRSLMQYTVLARLGEKGVAEDTLIVGVLLDRRQTRLLEVGDLSFQRRRLDGLADREIVQPSEQAFPCGIRIDFRLTQLTDREIGGPIAKLAEYVANVLSDIDELSQLRIVRNRTGIIGQLRGQIVVAPAIMSISAPDRNSSRVLILNF